MKFPKIKIKNFKF